MGKADRCALKQGTVRKKTGDCPETSRERRTDVTNEHP